MFKSVMNAILKLTLLASIPLSVHAAEAPPVVVYIQSQEYQHPIKLWQYFRDYWYTQGPYVEQAAKTAFASTYGDINTCQSDNNSGRVMVWLKPKMFFNPQLQIYYGEISAMAYTYDGKLLGTYEGEASKLGFIDVNTKGQLADVYFNSMQNLLSHMQADEKFQQAIQANVDEKSATPCSLIGILPEPKIRFMSF